MEGTEKLTSEAYAQGRRDGVEELLKLVDTIFAPELRTKWRILDNDAAVAFLALQRAAEDLKHKCAGEQPRK